MKIEVTKILAIGSYKRFMWVKITEELEICCKINESTYNFLKMLEVPTSQYLRWHKNEHL